MTTTVPIARPLFKYGQLIKFTSELPYYKYKRPDFCHMKK